ncbi:MAG TPA: DNA repair protein RadC [Armatimonadota bacterium]|jgi:DNA repair protein RadC
MSHQRQDAINQDDPLFTARRVGEMPADERPRERLKRLGPGPLKTSELLAILLRTGTASLSVLDVAERLEREFSSLKNISNAEIDELARTHGIGPVKAIELKAALELGRRLAGHTDEARRTITKAQDVVAEVLDMVTLPVEEFRILLLNTRNQVICQRTISRGTLNGSLVHPREVFRFAISQGSNSLICVHNHPSGDPSPSDDDLAITRRLVEAGKLIDIQVLDHVIIGSGRVVSLRDRGLM